MPASDAAVPATPQEPPSGEASVSWQFPLAGTTDAPSLWVRGRSHNAVAVLVQGVEVALDDRGDWRAEVELSPGANPITVQALGPGGPQGQAQSRTVVRADGGTAMGEGQGLHYPKALCVHPERAEVFVVDDGPDGVIRIDLQTSQRALVSGGEGTLVGEGWEVVRPVAVAVNGEDDRLYFTDTGPGLVLEAEPVHGDRTALASTGLYDAPSDPGSGPLGTPGRIALDASGTTLYVLDIDETPQVVAVDLGTLERTGWAARPDHEPSLRVPRDLAFDAVRGELWVMEDYRSVVIGIDVRDGARRTVTGEGVGSGADTEDMDLVAVGDDGALFVWDRGTDGLLIVDPDSGARRLVATAEASAGPWPGSVADIAAGQGLVFVLSTDEPPAVLAIDPETGDRVVVAR